MEVTEELLNSKIDYKLPSNFIDRTGMRYGKLTVIKYLGKGMWLCHCDCGNDTIVSRQQLPTNPKQRSTMSCGCGLRSRLTQNYDFFKEINTEEKAYLLGFLAADGCVTYTEKSSSYFFKLTVQRRDRDVLEKMKSILQTEAEIKDFTATTNLPQGGTCTSDFSSLLINGKELTQQLIDLGVTPHKILTLDIKYDKIPDDLKRHFWRGWLECDGCFGLYGEKQNLSMNIVTSETMCESTKKELSRFFPNMKISYYHVAKANKATQRFCITKQKDIKQFLHFIYDDATVYLDRKYQHWLEIQNIIENKL